MFTDTEITEAAAFQMGAELTGSRYKVRLIEGNKLGSSGYYPAATLLRDGPRIFVKGTPMYLDHQTAEEKANRPHGSVTTYAGELAEDAYYENDGLYAEIEVFEHQRPLIKSLKDRIGISIRATGRTIRETINGQSVPVFKELVQARSADFVVKAGAGGKIVSILESAVSDEDEGTESMDEVLEAIKALKTDFGTRLSVLEEAAKPAEPKVVTEVDYTKVVELAEALSDSKLNKAGRDRVLTLHKADPKGDIAALITAEEAYVKANVAEELEGFEESEESAKVDPKKTVELKMPKAWSKK